MKVTFVLPTVGMSGGIKVVAIYAKYLVDKGHEVFLVSVPRSKKRFLAKVKSFLTGKGWPKAISTKSHLDGLGLNHKVLPKDRQVVDGDVPGADVIVATWWETAEWVAKLRPSKGKKCYFIQGYEIFDFLPIERCKATYRLPLHKIVVAKWLAKIMSKEYGDHDVDVVPNSVDHEQFYAPIRNKQPVPTIGFLFSSTKLKGVDVTLKVLDKLRLSIPNLRVISFGMQYPDDSSLQARNVEFYQSPEQKSIRNLYAQCDVWVTASRSEGFNLPAMEAMACRTPVVATKTGWPEEAVLNGRNGFLTEIDDVVGLTSAASQILLASHEQWMAMSQSAFETVQHSSWSNSAELFENALRNAIKREC